MVFRYTDSIRTPSSIILDVLQKYLGIDPSVCKRGNSNALIPLDNRTYYTVESRTASTLGITENYNDPIGSVSLQQALTMQLYIDKAINNANADASERAKHDIAKLGFIAEAVLRSSSVEDLLRTYNVFDIYNFTITDASFQSQEYIVARAVVTFTIRYQDTIENEIDSIEVAEIDAISNLSVEE